MSDPRFATPAARLKNVDALEREIEAVLASGTTAEWVEKLDAAEVPGGPVYRYEQALADPHIRARNMVEEIEHPKIGRMKMMGRPLKSSGDLTAIRKPAPWLGQHSAEVLRGLGYSQDEIDRLFAERVVYDRYRT
jgi:crotonobetainyl-CoA:carnitine CoA-transferase CaiB-like acyl-CoA transferase